MSCLLAPTVTRNVQRERWLLTLSVEGDIRFISHHDMLRLVQRALARTGLPAKYTEGFNPRAKISLPLPRPVGIASLCELVVVEFSEPLDDASCGAQFAAQLPEGLYLVAARRLAPDEKIIPVRARYRFEPVEPVPEGLAEKIATLIEASSLSVTRNNPKYSRPRTIDVRPYLENISMEPHAIEFTLRITGAGTAKPAEIIGLLYSSDAPVNHRIQRLWVEWEQEETKENEAYE